jgi:hypothetical protein
MTPKPFNCTINALGMVFELFLQKRALSLFKGNLCRFDLGSVGELYTHLANIITRTEPYAAKPLNINFSGFAGLELYSMLGFDGENKIEIHGPLQIRGTI